MDSFLVFLTGIALSAEPCCIEIIDDENGWPVPLVELRTINNQRFISDNAGVIAIDEPDLLGLKLGSICVDTGIP